ncbi:MAG: thiamine phosphate synthase [Leptospirillia bacterium]
MDALPRLYLITNRKAVPGCDLIACLAAALAAGVRLVQLREKDLSARDLLTLAEQAQAVCAAHGARLLINDRADVALAVGAAGVHLTSADPPVAEVRDLLGSEALIGVSTHHPAEVVAAGAEGADFVTFGPVYDTPSKRGMGDPAGTAGLSRAVTEAEVPVFALGGVNAGRIREVMATGCHGAALISGVMASTDPGAASAALLEQTNPL